MFVYHPPVVALGRWHCSTTTAIQKNWLTPNTVRLRIFVGWVERSETQQTLQLLGFVPQPNLHIFIFWA
ncbi:MAG: hypothetical protein ACYT04_74250, partial [Nostoc sp.]